MIYLIHYAYVQLKIPAGAWVGNGLSQHYFAITQNQTCYVPLFKIEKNSESTNNDFRANTRFEIIGRHSASYYGEFMINYRSESGYSKDLLTLNLVGNSKLAQSDIIAVLDSNNTKIIVYRKMYSNSYPSNREVFIVDITGNNDKETNDEDINKMTYYCTTIYSGNGNEVILGSASDPDSTILTQEIISSLNYIPALINN